MTKARKLKKEKEKVEKPPQEERAEPENDDIEERDFGGLPNRNLKKNLGCGG